MAWSHGRSWTCHGKVTTQFPSLFHYLANPILSKIPDTNLLDNHRSLGDAVAHTAGVISEPEFTERQLNPAIDQFIVLATDGLWEFCDNLESAEIAAAASGTSQAVDKLVQEANARWIREEQVIDDTTVIVANLFDYVNGQRKRMMAQIA